MKRIRLTKNEKKALRGLLIGYVYPPDGLSRAALNTSLRSLQLQGLTKVAFVEGGNVENAEITDEGRAYVEQNPTLRNPIDYEKVAAILLLVTVVAIVVKLVIKFNEG